MRISVVLPAPLRPMSPSTAPEGISRLTLRSTVCAPYCLATPTQASGALSLPIATATVFICPAPVSCALLHQDPQPLEHPLGRKIELGRLAGELAQRALELRQAALVRERTAARLGHHHALAAAPLEESLGFQLAVGARHGHRVDRVMTGDVAHRRQLLARLDAASRDQPAQLG